MVSFATGIWSFSMNKKLRTILLCTAASVMGFSSFGNVFAWFKPTAVIDSNINLLDGSVEGAYFAYGNGKLSGSEEDDKPYGIRTPRHLYNLAWLTYLGYFNDKPQMYFELADNIDMSGWALPPIGTETYPFVGNFNGQGYVISNLVSTNNYADFGTKHPSKVTESYFNTDNASVDNHPNVVGFFGVTGNYLNRYSGDGTTAYSDSVNSIYNFGLKGTTAKSTTQNGNAGSLVGIVAGYSSTTIHDVAVDSSTITIDNGANAFDGSLTESLSEYSLIGYTTKKKKVKKIDETIYDVEISRQEEFNVPDGGDGIGWGGSINMLDLYNRLRSVKTNTAEQNNGFTNYTRTGFRYREYYTSNAEHVETLANYDTADNNQLLTYYNTNAREYGTYSLFNRNVNSNTYDYLYLMGGQNRITSFEEYYVHTKITDGNGNFMTVPRVNNNTNVTNGTDGISWTVPSTSTGYIYAPTNTTQYYLTIANDGVTLYIQNNEANATQFTREDGSDGHVRFVNNGKYLNRVGNTWRMDNLPAPPDSIGIEPPYPASVEDQMWTMDGKIANGYQVSITNNGLKYYMNNDYYQGSVPASWFNPSVDEVAFLTPSTDLTVGWTISNLPTRAGNTVTGTVKCNDYYLGINSSSATCSSNTAYFLSYSTTNNSTVNTWTIGLNSNGTYYFYQTKNRDTYYLTFDTDNNVFLVPNEAGTNNPTTNFVLERTSDIIDNHNDGLEAAYNRALEIHQDWVTSTQTYVDEYNEYLADIQNTYIVDTSAAAASYGPDTFLDEYNPDNDKMVYSGDNTTYIPLNVIRDGTYTNLANYAPQNSNTGYIVSSSVLNRDSAFDYGRRNITISKYPIKDGDNNNYLGKSFYNNEIHTVYTVDNDGLRIISENPNDTNYNPEASKYKKYNKSFKDFQNKLVEGNGSVYGFHFESDSIAKDKLVVAPKVKISNFSNNNRTDKTYTNYELPVNSIDFNLADRGFINFFAGTYFNGDATISTFFSLHQVIRDSNDKIINIKEIQAVYSDGEDDHSYIFQYKDAPIKFSLPYVIKNGVRYNLTLNGEQSYSQDNLFEENSTMDASQYDHYRANFGYKLAFNTDWITNYSPDSSGNPSMITSLAKEYLYYFEIPVNEGEFCLGAVQGGTGAYLCYLDIGANASKTQRTKTIEHFTRSESLFEYPAGVAVVDLSGNYTPGSGAYISLTDPTTGSVVTDRAIDVDDADCVCVDITVGYSGNFVIERTSDYVALTRATSSYATPTYKNDSITVVDSSSSVEIPIVPLSSTDYDVLRLRFYDYSAFADDWTVTEINDVKIGDEDYARTAVQYLHYGSSNQTRITNNSQMNIYDVVGINVIKYQYDETTGTYDFLDRNILSFSSSATDILITYRVNQNIISEETAYALDYILNMSIDYDSTEETTYRDFDNYQIVITPNETSAFVTIIDRSSGRVIYMGEVNQSNLITTDDIGNTIEITVP